MLVGRWEGGCGGRSPARFSSGGCVSSLMKKARSSSRSGSGRRSIASFRSGQPGERETVQDVQAALRAHLNSRLGFKVNPIGKAVFPYLTHRSEEGTEETELDGTLLELHEGNKAREGPRTAGMGKRTYARSVERAENT